MPGKIRTNITIDPQVLKKAKEYGLNVSKIAENALKEYIRRLEGSSQQTETNGGYTDTRSVSHQHRMVDGTGFEPATSAMPTPRSFQTDLPAQTLT
jgi:post-segregation antitoxin (ccd killing protein)